MPSSPAQYVYSIPPYAVYRTTSGGKAGKGCNKTASIQIFDVDSNGCIVKTFRFNVLDGHWGAAEKAKAWILAQPELARPIV